MGIRKGRLVNYCKTCARSFEKVERYSPKLNCCRDCHLEKTRQRGIKYRKGSFEKRRQHKLDLVNQLGGVCQMCGYSDLSCLAVFDFHHTGDKKIINLAEIINTYSGSKLGRKKANKEIKHCILVCSNCHRKIHLGDSDGN